MQPRTHFLLRNLQAPHGAPLLMEVAYLPDPSPNVDELPPQEERDLTKPVVTDSKLLKPPRMCYSSNVLYFWPELSA